VEQTAGGRSFKNGELIDAERLDGQRESGQAV
jgi:hypothetical protein